MLMFELLRLQAQSQAQLLTNCVSALARDPLAPEQLDACVCAARSFQGTAHMVGLDAGANLARTMDECLAAVHRGEIELEQELLGLMLRSADLLDCMTRLPTLDSLPPDEESAPEEECIGRGRRVLVVDDSSEVRELERKLLGFRGYDVVTAVDGVDAWHAICRHPFDLVLTDVDMPLIDGIKLIRRMRQDSRFVRLPVLIACDKDDVQQRWSGFDAGANYYVIKGSFHDTLVEAVSNLIGPAQPRR